MAETFEITDEMRAVIGRESAPWPYEVTTTGIRAFARGVGYDDPVYFDTRAALAAGYEGLPAPPCYLGTPVYLPDKSSARYSSPPGPSPALRHGLGDVLDGGTETVYERPILAGESLTGTTAVVDLETKQSRSLGVMLLVTSETVLRDPNDEVVARQRSQAIFY